VTRTRARRPAAGLAAGALIGASLMTALSWSTPADAASSATASAKSTNSGSEASKAAAANASPGVSTPAARSKVAARAVAAAPSLKPAARPAPAARRWVSPMVPREERVTYHYNALGRRDPFQSLVGGGFVGMDVGGNAPPDVGGIKVVGIVWGVSDKFALVEDPRGNSLVLRQGDKVMNGVVEELRRDALVVKLDMDGLSQSVTIPVTRKGESNESK
jgi:hypothetical protein